MWKGDFVHSYNRKNLQKKIDTDIFSDQTNTIKILNYLDKPAEFIEEKYEEIY